MRGHVYPEVFEAVYTDLPRLEDLDSNQRGFAERLVDRLYMHYPEGDHDRLVEAAVKGARANLATARVAAKRIAELHNGPAYCYLAFYGLGGVANFVKIGMTRHPEKRLYGMATGNPLDCLWVYVSRLPVAKSAFRVEQELHRHLDPNKRRGEWFSVGETDAGGAAALARQLHAVAVDADRDASEFTLLGYRDGR
ncbi:GIY-YIG nuclease family protein [Lysobacter panacisoli]|uniref:Bacteriophage T5 Orf172 DNA-binding domain-containing protein n=1 Tax=Lysobacter panacisoli TaxID=1255263 RepID=A0ABP9LFR3_9GAMM|nr:GIY-YIG nuclease family protein [Lysobacter panacisoli]